MFGSNEEMLAKLQAGGAGWDLFVPTNYTISTYAKLGLIDELDLVARCRTSIAATQNQRFTNEGTIDGKTYALPKNWGTTGIAVNTAKMKTPVTSWKEFFEVAQTEADGRAMVHDYQLTTIGNALVALGYRFNSVDAGRTRQGGGTADQGQAAPLRHQQRLPARNARHRCLDDHVLDQ